MPTVPLFIYLGLPVAVFIVLWLLAFGVVCLFLTVRRCKLTTQREREASFLALHGYGVKL